MRWRRWLAAAVLGSATLASAQDTAPLRLAPPTAIEDAAVAPAAAQTPIRALTPQPTEPPPLAPPPGMSPSQGFLPILSPGELANRQPPLGGSYVGGGAGGYGHERPRLVSGLWVAPQFLWLRPHGMRLPPLLTTEPTGLGQGALLGAPGTSVLVGNQAVNDEYRAGYEIRAGFWLGRGSVGVDGSYFNLGRARTEAVFASNGVPGLAAPFVGQGGVPFALPIASVNNPGSFAYSATTEIDGFDANLRFEMCSGDDCGRTDLLLGYRQMRLGDVLSISTQRSLGFFFAAPLALATFDRIETENTFRGGQIGLTGERSAGWIGVNWFAKVAVGETRRVVDLRGGFGSNNPLIQVVPNTGLYTAATNAGRYSRSEFGVLPEAGLNLRLSPCERLAFTVGYRVAYWNRVARAGDQIDRTFDGATRPTFLDATTDFWMHGLNAGVEWIW